MSDANFQDRTILLTHWKGVGHWRVPAFPSEARTQCVLSGTQRSNRVASKYSMHTIIATEVVIYRHIDTGSIRRHHNENRYLLAQSYAHAYKHISEALNQDMASCTHKAIH